jgi:hypothetical protein
VVLVFADALQRHFITNINFASMKKLSFSILAGSVLILSTANAQSQHSGVYLSANDYLQGRMSSTCDCGINPQQSAVSVSITNKQVIIKGPDQTFRVDKEHVYAVSYCGGRTVRIYKDGCYPILNQGEKILLYEVLATPVSKGRPFTTKYYFSNGAGSDIQALTLDNLRAEFSHDPTFESALDKQVNSDSELYSYDDFHKAYRLNVIYDACGK